MKGSKIAVATVLGAVLGMTLGGCASAPHAPPVVEDSQQAPIDREPAESPERETPAADSSAATTSLLAAAKRASEAENHDNAIAYLERAVRIDPRNAELWVALSAAHLMDGNIPAATQHARKAIALAGDDPAQSRNAWLQLADVREAAGNLSEAKAIRQRYRAVRG